MNSAYQTLTNIWMMIYYWFESMFLSIVPKNWRFKDITGETVLITGGGSGIGRLLAIRFANHGARIVVWDLNLEAAKETVRIVKEADGEAFAYFCDVSKPQNVYEAAALVKKDVGKVDILVNNAGIVTGKKFLELPDHMIQKTFEVNAISHFWTCKAFLPEMMSSNHGHLVSIASMAGLAGVVKLTDYCASKFAAVGFEESLRMELFADGYTGVHSTVICPYFINTGMFQGANPGLFTMMTPEFVADQVVAAVLINQEVLLLPKGFNILMILKAMFACEVTKHAVARHEVGACNNLVTRAEREKKAE